MVMIEPDSARRARRQRVKRPPLRALLTAPWWLLRRRVHRRLRDGRVRGHLEHLPGHHGGIIRLHQPHLGGVLGSHAVLVGRRPHRRQPQSLPVILAGFLVSTVAWMIYGTAENLTLFMIVNVLEGFAIACSYPAKQAFLVQVSPPRWLGAGADHRSGDHRHAACDTAGNADGPGHLRCDSRIHPDIGGRAGRRRSGSGGSLAAPSLGRGRRLGRRVSFAEAESMALGSRAAITWRRPPPQESYGERTSVSRSRGIASEGTRLSEGALRRNCRGIEGKAGAPKTRTQHA